MWLNLYNGKEQKEHLDEELERVLERAGWTQTFSLEFVRLALGFVGVGIAGVIYWLEKTRSFRDTKSLVALLCAVYFVSRFALWAWHKYVERSAQFVGTKNGTTVYIQTDNPANSDVYKVTVLLGSASTTEEYKIQELVDNTGVVHQDRLQQIVRLVDKKQS